MSGAGLDLDTDPVWPRRPSRMRRWLAEARDTGDLELGGLLIAVDVVLLAALLVVLLW